MKKKTGLYDMESTGYDPADQQCVSGYYAWFFSRYDSKVVVYDFPAVVEIFEARYL